MSQPAARSDRRVSAIVVAALAAGLIIRLWVLVGPLGALDSDEAIVGLMARHVPRGEIPIFYWGQTYGGSHEALLAAPSLALFGPSVAALKAVPLILDVTAAWLVWRIGRKTIGEPAARLGAALFWIWPAAFVWWSTKARGTYWVPLVLGLLVFLAGLRLAERLSSRTSPKDAVLFGAALGLGWWASPQIVYLALPIMIFLAVRARWKIFSAWPALPAALAGALPWLIFNVRHGWASFDIPPQPEPNGYLDHLGAFFSRALPTALGFKVPFSGEWLMPGIASLLFIVVLAVLVWALARLSFLSMSLPLVVVLYPFLFSLSPFSWYVEEPRYLLFLAPAISLVLAGLATRRPGPQLSVAPDRALRSSLGAVVLLGVAALLTTGGIAKMISGNLAAPGAPDVRVPKDLSALASLFESYAVDRVFADYWVAHRISFETSERVVATPFEPVRYRPHDRLVRASDSPDYVFVSGSRQEAGFRSTLYDRGIAHQRIRAGQMIVYLLDAKVLPEEVGLSS